MSKLICPICNTATALTPERMSVKAPLDDDSHEYIHFVKIIASLQSDDYAIVRCQACGDIFVAERTSYDEWTSVYPICHKTIANEIHSPINDFFKEASLCFAIGAYTATVTMCQVTMEALWREKEVSGLNDLLANGIISDQLFKRATEIRLWAGITKHELINETISKDDAEQLLAYLESILDSVYVQPARLAALTTKREEMKRANKSSERS